MAKRITKRIVEDMEPGDAVWDSELRGFGVRCRPSGAKYYGLKTRVGGRQRWFTIGRHGSPWNAEMARTEAKRLLGQKAAGKDPAAERDRKKQAVSVKELGERFLADYVAVRLKPKTAKDYRALVEKIIIPTLGHYGIVDLTRADVSRFHHDNRRRPYAANRALAVLSKMLNLAEQWGLRPDNSNPCRHVERYDEVKHERYLTPQEFQQLGETLAKAEASNAESPYFIALIRLLTLTGARLNEIATLKWEHVDFENALLRLPDTKTGRREIPLNPPALDVLRSLPRELDNTYVIVGAKEGSHLVNVKGPWGRIRKEAGIPDVRIHDLRHSFASAAVSGGMSLPIIGKLLGHTQAQTTQRYSHMQFDPLREASGTVGAGIFEAMTPKSAKGKHKRRRVRL